MDPTYHRQYHRPLWRKRQWSAIAQKLREIHLESSAKGIFIPGDLKYFIDKDLSCFIESATRLQKLSFSRYELNGIHIKDLIGSSELSHLCHSSLHEIIFECNDLAVRLEHHAHHLERINLWGIVLKDFNWGHMFDRIRGILSNSLSSSTLSYLLYCSGDGQIMLEEIFRPDSRRNFYQHIRCKADKPFRSALCSNVDYPYGQDYLKIVRDAIERLRLE